MAEAMRPTIDLSSERVLSLPQAARFWPSYRGGKPTHASTILRQILDGKTAPDGRRVYLGGLKLGGRWVTSVEAIQRYAESLTPGGPATSATLRRTTAARRRAMDAAERECRAAGL